MSKEFYDLFELGMKRRVIPIIPAIEGPQINLGADSHQIPNAMGLDLPTWDANTMPIPYEDASVRVVHAYHFLEHVEDPVAMLFEIQRVLMPGGVCNVVVPYYTSQMAYHDLQHKSWWTEETWKNIFGAPYARATDGQWKLGVGFNMICGVVERNLALMTQLFRMP